MKDFVWVALLLLSVWGFLSYFNDHQDFFIPNEYSYVDDFGVYHSQ